MKSVHDEQAILAGCLAYLCEPPDIPPGRQPRHLRPGHCAVILPARDDYVIVSRDPSQYHVAPWEMGRVRVPKGPPVDPGSPLGGGLGGIGRGFRAARLSAPSLPDGVLGMLRDRAIASPDGRKIQPNSSGVPRPGWRNGATECASALMDEVLEAEGELCQFLLSCLPGCGAGRACAIEATADGLIKALGRLNADRPVGMRLDTAFMSSSGFSRLAGGGGLQIPGCAVVADERLPDGAAYFTSFRLGPALARGPTVIRCLEDEFHVEHYCEMLPLPPGATPGVPPGFSARLAL